jgi:hypothetical protein
MRKGFFYFLILLGLSVLTGSGCSPKKLLLWNGRNLSGWKVVTADGESGSEDVWSVKDGVIRCTGTPTGYLRTDSDYSNYILTLEWRWIESEGNSGVLVHTQTPDKVWPNCIECQLQSEHAGDFVLIGPGAITVDQAHYISESGYKIIPKMGASSEKTIGEWNHYRIICSGGEIDCFVNGVLQNHGTEAALTKGKICLQSEGAPVEFRNIYLEWIR